MTCRDEILRCLHKNSPTSEFSIAQVVRWMNDAGTAYSESTIRTHISSRLCASAPDNHAVTHDDLIRVSHGKYRLR